MMHGLFTLGMKINGQNNRYWFLKNPSAVHEVPLLDLNVGLWCATNTQKMRGFMFLVEKNFDLCVITVELTENEEFFARTEETFLNINFIFQG